MKRKLLSLCCTFALIASMAAVSALDSQASSEEPMIDGSYLTHDDESVGYDTKITRGEDLLTGYSKGVEIGPGKFYAGGSTLAAHTVDEVGVSVSVERAQKGDDHWSGYRVWHKFNQNADRVSANQLLEVEGGYYYRVYSVHSANDDVSDSFTNGVYVAKPDENSHEEP